MIALDLAWQKLKISTGITGLDNILKGGLYRNRVYLIEGDPGTGKTTLGLQFLLEGIRKGERSMYVSLSENTEEMGIIAISHGWSLQALEIYELFADKRQFIETEEQYTFFLPSEIELGRAIQNIVDQVRRVKPVRLVIDSLSELRLLAGDSLRYRRNLLGLKQILAGENCTVLLLNERNGQDDDGQRQSLAHGVISLHQLAPQYGAERRRLRVVKMRGTSFRGGYHDFVIKAGGIQIFPRLVSSEHHSQFDMEPIQSGIGQLDSLLGGGIFRGSSTLLLGPAGAGKSTIATQYAVAAMDRGEHAAIFVFDEGLRSVLTRCKGYGVDLEPYLESRKLRLVQINTAELSPGEFAHRVRRYVEKDPTRVLVIDSLNGYINAMPEERFLVAQLHELLSFLNQKGVATILVYAQHGLLGSSMATPVDVSYLSDTVLLFRYFEVAGEVKKALSVVKRRGGAHEQSIRELSFGEAGPRLGEPLRNFQGVLSGTPSLLGEINFAGATGHGEHQSFTTRSDGFGADRGQS